ncbi:LacI family DNA-binding transcriptional regulator [Candidatus Leptofilum sp.]|uniref:LacI family DNA-binding transcriptional regulator n=1 Tax=Candidatus Leptofilum sp. TaxID=3241576 RepID=UPI003B5B8EC7
MKRTTIEDVAALAGVSRQTVSRAINNKGEISKATKEKVMAAVAELGYQPNRLAQGMVTQRTRTVGLVVPDITNLFFPEVARGVQDEGRLHDYNVLLCNTDDEPEEEIKTMYSLAAQRVDGIISMGSKAPEEQLMRFANTFRPIVLINRLFEHDHVSVINVDNFKGAQLAVNHLLNQGHRQIGMLVNQDFTRSQVRRVQGYQQALAEFDLPQNESYIVDGAPTLQGGYAALKQLLSQSPEVTAVFTYNDLMALGAIRAAHDLDKKVPDDVAIMGFDDIGMAAMFTPSLSTVRVDKYAIGQIAMRRLLEMLDNPNEPVQTINIDIDLVIRESTN